MICTRMKHRRFTYIKHLDIVKVLSMAFIFLSEALQNSSINDLLNEEFNIGGYYSSWTIDSLFNIFYEENEKNHSNFIVFTFAETGILINKLQEEITLGGEVRKIEPHIAIMSTFDNKDINFNKNFLICPLFSTDRMRDRDTLQTSDQDINDHSIILYNTLERQCKNHLVLVFSRIFANIYISHLEKSFF